MDGNIGRVIAYVGSMGCGKTKKVIDLYEEMVGEGIKVSIFKPFISREGEDDAFVHARNGKKAPAIPIDYLDEIVMIADDEKLQAVMVDEIQFFEDDEPYKLLEGLAMSGLEVYVFGLDVTSDNETFGDIGDILAHADEVHKLRTACVKCGEEARISKFVGEEKEDTVHVGDLGDYEPQCRSCYFGWKERLAYLKKHAKITIGNKDFFFTCDVELERLKEMGYSPETVMGELNTIEKVMDFVAKLKKVE